MIDSICHALLAAAYCAAAAETLRLGHPRLAVYYGLSGSITAALAAYHWMIVW